LVIGLYGFFHSPLFTVQDIQAQGSSYPVEKLASIAGIEMGTSLLRVDVDHAMRRLEEEPIVSRAIVRRHLPDTVYIDVEEHVPVGIVPLGSEFWGVAVDGTVLGRIDMNGISLPIITGADPASLVVGRKNLAELILATSIIDALPAGVIDSVSEVNVSKRDGLRLISRELVEFHLGDPGRMTEKLQVVAAFLPRLHSLGSSAYVIVDVSSPERPVVRKSP
ncbi:MAG: FtsQ-type POTRA domain-containing protein, partial [Firmicutes bacterium]|nr:FtsQ-type POTRA domain-containing protein [Bacillota bacterium]